MNDRVASVLLLPPEREEEILSLAQEWTSAWMIRSAVWVSTSGIRPTGDAVEPPRMTGRVLGRNGSAEVDLFDELSRHEFPLVRFVAVRSVEAGSPGNLELDRAVDLIEEHLRLSKPEGTRIQFINLVFSPSKRDGADSGLMIERAWNANVVVSPEDRRTGNSFDAFTRHTDPERWAGFVLAHTVTAAGLWATLPAGPYDEREFDGYMEGTHIQRVVVRGVLTGALVVNVARQAMEKVSADQSPLADPLIAAGEDDLRLLAPGEEAKALEGLVAIAMELGDGQLAYRPAEGPKPLPRRRIGAIQQTREFLKFSADKVIDSPRWVVRKIRGRSSKKATQLLHGADSDTQVDVDRILSWEDAQFVDEVAELNERREGLLEGLDGALPARRYDIDGSLFEALREACFSLVDGSPLPEGRALTEQVARGGSPTVVSATSIVVPDWRKVWEPPASIMRPSAQSEGTVTDNWLDVRHSRRWFAEIDKRLEKLSQREEQLLERLGDTTHELSDTEDLLVESQSRVESLRDEVRWLEEDLELETLSVPLEVIEGDE